MWFVFQVSIFIDDEGNNWQVPLRRLVVSTSDCQCIGTVPYTVHRNSPGGSLSASADTVVLKTVYGSTLTKIGRMGFIFRIAGPGVQGRGVPQHDHRDQRGARLRTREGSRFPSAPPPPPRAASGAHPGIFAGFSLHIINSLVAQLNSIAW